MIPSMQRCHDLWDTYTFPVIKRKHVNAVLSVATAYGRHIEKNNPEIILNWPLITAGCLLHDIDKAVEKLPGEKHPDASVRILKGEGCDETLLRLVKRHSLHMIFDQSNHPETLEEKLVYLSDKSAKYEPIGIEKRFELWNKEHMTEESQSLLKQSYQKVVALRDELVTFAHTTEKTILDEAMDIFYR
jgi:HD superfamily phosphodiesterase